jgi:hypothetical protein
MDKGGGTATEGRDVNEGFRRAGLTGVWMAGGPEPDKERETQTCGLSTRPYRQPNGLGVWRDEPVHDTVSLSPLALPCFQFIFTINCIISSFK